MKTDLPLETSESQESQGRFYKKRQAAKKHIRQAFVLAGVSIALISIVAVGYVWYTGQSYEAPVTDIEASGKSPSLPDPVVQSDTAPVGVSVQAYSETMQRDSVNHITVRTRQYASCSVEKEFNGVKSQDPTLSTVYADKYGMVYWHWQMPKTSLVGEYKLHIYCSHNDKSGYYQLRIKLL